MDNKKVSCYAHFSDARGEFFGLINHGEWQEINYVVTRAGEIRGNHFHKDTREMVFLLKGEVEVQLKDINDPAQNITFTLKQGEGVEVQPYVLHTMRYLTDT